MRSNDIEDRPPAHELAEFVEGALQGPVGDLARRTKALLGEVEQRQAEDYRADLTRTKKAASHLAEIAATILDTVEAPGADRSAAIRTVRHDLRTPITAILGYGEMVAEEAGEKGDAWLAAPLGEILGLATHLLAVIDGLSGFARSETPPDGAIEAEPSPAAIAAGTMAGPRGEPASRGLTGRILVVDDNPAMRDLISRRLGRHGHEVAACNSGEAALDLTAEGGFDLVMLDLLMPGIDGLETLKRLKGREASQTIPVIVMSALDEVEAAVRCIEAGADDYLSKPLDETLLGARIGSSLERKFLRDRERETLDLLKAEQERSDALLHNILPVSVVKRLRAGEAVIADHFDEVTVLFCDLVGFTGLSAKLEPAGTLMLLEDIFSRFDEAADRNGLEKIKTIGDAYMVVGGIPDRIPDSARRVVAMASEMPGLVRSTRHGAVLDIRVGIHTGPAAAGIVGTKKFFYDVWGDTVNIASRLEASSEPGRIHVSAATVTAAGSDFAFAERPPVELQGKGRMQTFYLETR